MDDKGTTCLIAGHADKHEGDCYRMWDPNKHSTHVTRDVKWLKRMHFNASRQNQSSDYAIEVPLNPESVAGESETTNSGSTSVPFGPRTLRVTIGGAEVINLEEEKYDGDDDGDPQLFSQVQTRTSRTCRTIYSRQLCQNEHQCV